MHTNFYNTKSFAHQTERVDNRYLEIWVTRCRIEPIYLVSLIFGFSQSKLVYGF